MTDEAIEDVEAFRARAREWIRENLQPRPGTSIPFDIEAEQRLQAKLFDAGFTGFAFPREYGGAGLTLDHQEVFFEEARDFVLPGVTFGVSIGMMGPTLLDLGSEAQKARHLPAILRGDEIFIQLLSEPSGGSDMAGALTRATRDGDTWVINGSKIWSSGAHVATHGMLLARTDWEVTKHRGLSMFIVPLGDYPGVTIEPIMQVNGDSDFCQEFFDDVVIPGDYLLGDENEGWSVAQRLLYHERNTTAGVGIGLGYMGRRTAGSRVQLTRADHVRDLLDVAVARGAEQDPTTRQLLGRVYTDLVAHDFLKTRIMTGQQIGALDGPWGSLLKLGEGIDSPAIAALSLAIAGSLGVIDTSDSAGEQAKHWLDSRVISIGGGTNEVQRNIVSERLLGLPREHDPSRELPFSEIQRRRREAGR